MTTQETITALNLIASTIEELEINNVIAAEAYDNQMRVHLEKLTITPISCITWKERFESCYNWEKSFTYNNIHFFSLLTQEEYDKENQA